MTRTINNKGFTLIELLVVIAIIGILAGIVLASLGNARGGANDAKVKEQLSSMRAQAELYTNSSATAVAAGTCAATAGTLFETANNGLGNLFNGLTLTNSLCASQAGLPSSGAAWAVEFPLNSGGYWCVDSTGLSAPRTGTVTSTVCPAS